MAFDKTKPFGLVRGLPGIKYEQAGTLYNPQGEAVNLEGSPITNPDAKAKTKTKNARPDGVQAGVRPMSEAGDE